MASNGERDSMDGILPSKIHPSYLHANSTSHIWAFSAIAELIDNAYDPDVDAKELYIDKEIIDGQSCLVFFDNGNSMNKDKLLNMLSFGYCEKDMYNDKKNHKPVGLYGNGFKSGSMRLGKDAIVFTRCHGTACIGLLSQTYLKKVKAKTIIVPILEYTLPKPIMQMVESVNQNNLDAILQHSPFKTEAALKEMLDSFESYRMGTKIIIYNLERLQDGSEELDFESDPEDIRCPQAFAKSSEEADYRPTEYVPEYRNSLRAYCSILYFKPKMKIFIREQVVKTKYIAKMLHETRTLYYKPSLMPKTEGNPIKIVLGFSCERDGKQNYGFLMYNKNRLIQAYEKVGFQKTNNEKGVGVIGVVELDFLTTVHNKQSFLKDEQYKTVENAMARKLNDYWNALEGSNSNDEINEPDWNWAQCDRCRKWRRLPRETDPKTMPDKWFCHMNKDEMYNRCTTEEEPDHLETPEESIKTTKVLTPKPKGRSKGKKSTIRTIRTQSERQTDSRNGHEPRPRETPVRIPAKRHFKSTHAGRNKAKQPRPGCSKDPDELVDDDMNNASAKKPYQGNILNRSVMGKNESNSNNLNTELEEAMEELQSIGTLANATESVPCSIENVFSWDKNFKETGAIAAPACCFKQSDTPPANEFSKGMKLEAKDPRNHLSSCIATVINMQGPRLCLRLDFNGDQNDFWCLVDSCDLHPVGYCEKNNEILQPPVGFQHDCSKWPAFLRDTLENATLAPGHCFKKEPPTPANNKFEVGHKLEAVDRKHHALICPATIGDIKEDEIYVVFDGFHGPYDYWCRYDSRDIFPVGWCERSGHELSSPSGKGTPREKRHDKRQSPRSNTSKLKDNETRIATETNVLTRFHKQVYRLLTLMAPASNLGEEADIETVVDTLINIKIKMKSVSS